MGRQKGFEFIAKLIYSAQLYLLRLGFFVKSCKAMVWEKLFCPFFPNFWSIATSHVLGLYACKNRLKIDFINLRIESNVNQKSVLTFNCFFKPELNF